MAACSAWSPLKSLPYGNVAVWKIVLFPNLVLQCLVYCTIKERRTVPEQLTEDSIFKDSNTILFTPEGPLWGMPCLCWPNKQQSPKTDTLVCSKYIWRHIVSGLMELLRNHEMIFHNILILWKQKVVDNDSIRTEMAVEIALFVHFQKNWVNKDLLVNMMEAVSSYNFSCLQRSIFQIWYIKWSLENSKKHRRYAICSVHIHLRYGVGFLDDVQLLYLLEIPN